MGASPFDMVGWRFKPTDVELVLYYLGNKILGNPLPCEGCVMECDLYGEMEPWEIWEFGASMLDNRYDEDMYFFTPLQRMTVGGRRVKRTVGRSGGNWHGEDSKTFTHEDGLTWIQKRFRYENPKCKAHHGQWIMMEYSLDQSSLNVKANFVVCRIRKNGTKNGKKRKLQELMETPVAVDACSEVIPCNDPNPLKIQRVMSEMQHMVPITDSDESYVAPMKSEENVGATAVFPNGLPIACTEPAYEGDYMGLPTAFGGLTTAHTEFQDMGTPNSGRDGLPAVNTESQGNYIVVMPEIQNTGATVRDVLPAASHTESQGSVDTSGLPHIGEDLTSLINLDDPSFDLDRFWNSIPGENTMSSLLQINDQSFLLQECCT